MLTGAAATPVMFRRVKLPSQSEEVPLNWYADSPSLTHFFNALSAVFPDGEKYFIDAVRAFESQVEDPGLKADVREFVRQEGHHTHHHRVANGRIAAMGVPMERCAAIARHVLGASRRRDSAMMQLAKTAAFEHFTALLGDWLLQQVERDGVADAHQSMAPLWLWHALEETEHKAVAFDVYQAMGGGYLMRAWAMVRVATIFLPRIHQMQLILLTADPRPLTFADLGRCVGYLYGRGGTVSTMLSGFFTYLHWNFHPWQHDNAALAARFRALLAEHVVGGAA